MQSDCCVASCRAALSSSHCAALSSSCHPLTAPPSCCLISPAGCCVTSCCTALSSSSHSTALIVLRRLVVVLPLVAPPSRRAALLSSPRPLPVLPSCCFISPAGCCIASCGTNLLLSSHSAALLSSCAGWLLHCLSLHRPLILLSCHPLILLLSSTLNLSSLGFLDPFNVTFVVPRERSRHTSPAWPLAHTRWSRRQDQTSSMNRMLSTLPCLAQSYSSPNVSARSAS
jgi:hypothetical protein